MQRTTETGPDGAPATIAYDRLGRLITRTVAGQADTFGYDTLGRINTENSTLGGFTHAWLGETDQPVSETLAGTPVSTAYGYEDNTGDRRLKSIVGNVLNQSYTTDAEARLLTKTEANANATYSYDAADRLTSTTGPTANTYTYDPSDNLTHITGSVTLSAATNVNNELPKVTLNGATSTWTYDRDGNLLSDGTRTFTWDAENRLLSIFLNGKPTKFAYDGLSRRTSLTDNGVETRYLWCGEQICAARTASGTTTARYYPQGELTNGIPRYYARDRLGSVRALMDNTGKAKGTATYDAYGRTTLTGETPAFAYAGMFYHKRSGLYLTQYRAYNPDVGRWISRDPIGENGGLNLFAYVGGNPANYSDRTGQCPACIIGIGVLIGAGAGGGTAYYMTDGNLGATATGAVVGGATGAIAPAAAAIAVEYGGATAGTAAFSSVSGAGAAGGTAIINYETGQPLGNDVATSAIMGATAPIFSGEAIVAGIIGDAAGVGADFLGFNSGVFGIIGAILDKGFLNKEPTPCDPLGKGSPLGDAGDFGIG